MVNQKPGEITSNRVTIKHKNIMSPILGMIAGGAVNAAITGINNAWSQGMTHDNMQYNYELNEQAAQNADARTRALYRDFYSPEALMKQYRAAGLSPSMMFGGTPGQGGMSGAHGAGTAGQAQAFMPMSMLEAAQVANIAADTKKKEAETGNIGQDTELKRLAKDLQTMMNDQYRTEYTLLNTGFQMEDGSFKSYYDIAGKYDKFDNYIAACREAAINAGDQEAVKAMTSEQGIKTMRTIFMANKEMSRDIQTLKTGELSAKFQRQLISAMQANDFANLSAKEAVQRLKTSIELNSISEDKQGAWNRLLNHFGEKGSIGRDIVIILYSLLKGIEGHIQGKMDLVKSVM